MVADTLYYKDSHLREFDSVVLSCEKAEKGYAVTLENTAFYPEGGGQPCDLGTLGDAKILKVWEENDRVLHLCDKALSVGETVHGVLDWQRRFDNMQQHSGEHILSGLIHKLYGFHNVGFHMGADSITIDFDGVIPQEMLPELERQVNGAIWADLPLHIWYPSAEELPTLPYRSKKPLSGLVRLVEVPGWDLCACCGTHVSRTGEIGMLKILSWTHFHQGVRMEILCGRRALSYLSGILEQNRLVSQACSAKPLETGSVVQKMLGDLEAAKARAGQLERESIEQLALSLEGKGDQLIFREDLSSEGLRRLADRVGTLCGGNCCILCGNDTEGYRYAACSRVSDMRAFSKDLNKALNGRGGGSPELVQGTLKSTKETIHSFFSGVWKI